MDDDATKEKGRRNTKAAGSNHNDKDAPITARQKAKKAMMEPKPGVLGDLEPGSLDSRNNIAKKSAVSQKGRSKSSAKGREQGDMTLAGKVTKSGNESSTKNSSKSGTKTSAARESSPEKPEQAGSRKPNAPEKDEDLHLDEATRRRMDWTPPTETTSKGVPASDDNDDLANDNDKRARSGFGKLLSDYSCSVSSSGTRNIASNAGGGGLTKRRRIEV